MARALQALKIRQIGAALAAAGVVTLDQQAEALGLCRSTTWTILQAAHKNSGLTAAVINRMFECPQLPASVRVILIEYVEEKISGRYGHSDAQLHRFSSRLVTSHLLAERCMSSSSITGPNRGCPGSATGSRTRAASASTVKPRRSVSAVREVMTPSGNSNASARLAAGREPSTPRAIQRRKS